jgi:hypothetical protein
VAIHNHLPSSTALIVVTATTAVILVWRRGRIEWTADGSRQNLLVGLTSGLLFLGFLPALIEQVKYDPGNLTLLYRFFGDHGPEIHPWAEVIDELGQAATDPLVVLGSWAGLNLHSPAIVLVLLVFFLGVSIVQARRSDLRWRFVLVFVWVTLAATVIAARNVPGDLHPYLFYYLYGLVGLLQLFVVKEVWDRWVAPHLVPDLVTPAAHLTVLAGVVFFLGWGAGHRAAPPASVDRYRDVVVHYGLEGVDQIHLFVDRKAENDQVWGALPTLALRFRRDGTRVTVPHEYVFLCGEEMRPRIDIHPRTLVITQRRPVGPDDRYLAGEVWGTFLLGPEDWNPSAFLAKLPPVE